MLHSGPHVCPPRLGKTPSVTPQTCLLTPWFLSRPRPRSRSRLRLCPPGRFLLDLPTWLDSRRCLLAVRLLATSCPTVFVSEPRAWGFSGVVVPEVLQGLCPHGSASAGPCVFGDVFVILTQRCWLSLKLCENPLMPAVNVAAPHSAGTCIGFRQVLTGPDGVRGDAELRVQLPRSETALARKLRLNPGLACGPSHRRRVPRLLSQNHRAQSQLTGRSWFLRAGRQRSGRQPAQCPVWTLLAASSHHRRARRSLGPFYKDTDPIHGGSTLRTSSPPKGPPTPSQWGLGFKGHILRGHKRSVHESPSSVLQAGCVCTCVHACALVPPPGLTPSAHLTWSAALGCRVSVHSSRRPFGWSLSFLSPLSPWGQGNVFKLLHLAEVACVPSLPRFRACVLSPQGWNLVSSEGWNLVSAAAGTGQTCCPPAPSPAAPLLWEIEWGGGGVHYRDSAGDRHKGAPCRRFGGSMRGPQA